MRFLIILVLTLVLSACAATVPSVPTTEDARQHEAEQLVRFSLTERIIENVRSRYFDQVGQLLAAKEVPPEQAGQVVKQEMEQMIESEHQRLLDALVPIYRRYYTAEEIHQLLSFYETEVARKSIRVSGQIAAEGQEFVRLWNEQFIEAFYQNVVARLQAEGIELEP